MKTSCFAFSILLYSFRFRFHLRSFALVRAYTLIQYAESKTEFDLNKTNRCTQTACRNKQTKTCRMQYNYYVRIKFPPWLLFCYLFGLSRIAFTCTFAHAHSSSFDRSVLVYFFSVLLCIVSILPLAVQFSFSQSRILRSYPNKLHHIVAHLLLFWNHFFNSVWVNKTDDMW